MVGRRRAGRSVADNRYFAVCSFVVDQVTGQPMSRSEARDHCVTVSVVIQISRPSVTRFHGDDLLLSHCRHHRDQDCPRS